MFSRRHVETVERQRDERLDTREKRQLRFAQPNKVWTASAPIGLGEWAATAKRTRGAEVSNERAMAGG
jgi:hypothetical protein